MKDPDAFRFGLLVNMAAHRYLICNTIGREDGTEKAIRHRELCEAFLAFHYLIPVDCADNYSRDSGRLKRYGDPRPLVSNVWLTGYAPYDFVHDHTQQLTSHLENIGMPMDDRFPDYDRIVQKFVKEFYRLATEAVSFWASAETPTERT